MSKREPIVPSLVELGSRHACMHPRTELVTDCDSVNVESSPKRTVVDFVRRRGVRKLVLAWPGAAAAAAPAATAATAAIVVPAAMEAPVPGVSTWNGGTGDLPSLRGQDPLPETTRTSLRENRLAPTLKQPFWSGVLPKNAPWRSAKRRKTSGLCHGKYELSIFHGTLFRTR
ncbi:uncharacterized protein LOC122630969 [Vespula pensylvanica]|uniref:uncharacterized protein LOC122630969 n=1 Tax=Vespula pensylvanica TaxID=30213 RepID=UPI001CBA40B8|nr:uncharacterized protein LOC122630969 [Vespula pensylvanica]